MPRSPISLSAAGARRSLCSDNSSATAVATPRHRQGRVHRGRSTARAVAGVCLGWSIVLLPGHASSQTGPTGADQVTYAEEPIGGGAAALRERFTAAQLALLEKLNRRDLGHLARAATLIVPSRWDLDEIAYSPLPADYAAGAALPKLLIVHQPTQVFGAYEYGRLVRWGPVSTGRRSMPTPPGLFHLNWRSTGRHSTVDPDWYMSWYFNFENRRGLSIHEYVLPGRPESHACVRLLRRDARWLFEWGEEWELSPDGRTVVCNGTPLFVVGRYAFDQPAPWTVPERVGERAQIGPLPESP